MPNSSHQNLYSIRKKNLTNKKEKYSIPPPLPTGLFTNSIQNKSIPAPTGLLTNSIQNKSIPTPTGQMTNNSPNSMVGNIAQGFSFGLGSSLAHRVTNSFFEKEKDKEKNKDINKLNCEELKKDLKICELNAGFNCGRVEELYLACINNIIIKQ